MARTLVLAEVVDGALAPVTAEAVTAAVELGGDVVLAVTAPKPATLVAQAAYAGVTEIVTVSAAGSDRDHDQAVQVGAALIEDVEPDVVVAAFTIRASSYAGALAHSADLGLVTDVVALRRGDSGGHVATRSVYDGRVLAEVALASDRPAFVLVRPSVWGPAEGVGTPAVRELAVTVVPSAVRSVELVRPSGEVDLTRANVIFSVGRGVGSEENLAVFADIAAKLGVALGASRPIVDAGWLPAVHQVGQTGVTVKPRVYVAFGISGALHHLAGMQNAQTIVVVNTDRNAPMFGFADVGAVEDIHDVADALNALV
jgi:electron transfer flavoprotein alpha subunit